MTKAKMLAIAAAAFAIGAAVAGGNQPGVAHATSYPDTDGYIAALIRDGIDPNPASRSIIVGLQICTKLRSGVGEPALINTLDDDGTDPPRQFVVTVVTEAHTYLCPDVITSNGRGQL